ncbi:MAG: hypothetical protein WCO60_20240, partial [Verrucomicrobiota bacterium]
VFLAFLLWHLQPLHGFGEVLVGEVDLAFACFVHQPDMGFTIPEESGGFVTIEPAAIATEFGAGHKSGHKKALRRGLVEFGLWVLGAG